MKKHGSRLFVSLLLVILSAGQAHAAEGKYHVIKSARVGGAGGFDYVFADSDSRRLYIPRGDRVTVFDLDTLEPAGVIADAKNVHGAVIDPKSHHGFSSSKPVVMWDTATLKTIKTIEVEGAPDGILFDPFTERILVLSHRAPNATVIDGKDGAVVGTIDLGGAPEQGVSDGKGRLYIDIEDKDNVAVVDAQALTVLAHYPFEGKGGTPAGLAFDVKNGILFACCRNPATAVILNASSGKILTALPIGAGTDGAVFNPATMEAFSSQRDGTMTVIKETAPDRFEVEQNVETKPGAKTLALDSKTGHIILITAEQGPPPPPAPGDTTKKAGRGAMVPDSFTILVVGK